MLLVLGTFRLPPDQGVRALPAMTEMVTRSRAEAGCIDYRYAEDILDPGLVHVTEVWTDREALDRHFASEHIRAWRAAWPELGLHDRQLRVHEVEEGRPV